MIFKNKNDYSCIIFRTGQDPFKVTYVNDLQKMLEYANKHYSGFKYMNVYNRRSGVYMGRLYKDAAHIVKKPRHLF